MACVCATAETRHLDRLAQLGEFEQEHNTDSEQTSNTDSHRAQSEAQAAQQAGGVCAECGGRRQPACIDADGNGFCTFTERSAPNSNGVCFFCGSDGRVPCLSALLLSLQHAHARCRERAVTDSAISCACFSFEALQ